MSSLLILLPYFSFLFIFIRHSFAPLGRNFKIQNAKLHKKNERHTQSSIYLPKAALFSSEEDIKSEVRAHSSFFLGLFIQSINHVKQSVGGNDIVECLRSALGVDGAANIGEIAEQVEAVKHEGHVALHEFLRHSCVPN